MDIKNRLNISNDTVLRMKTEQTNFSDELTLSLYKMRSNYGFPCENRLRAELPNFTFSDDDLDVFLSAFFPFRQFKLALTP